MIRLAAIINLFWVVVCLTGINVPVTRAYASGHRHLIVNVRSRSWSGIAESAAHTAQHCAAAELAFRPCPTQGHYCLRHQRRLIGQLPDTALFVRTPLLRGLKYDRGIGPLVAVDPAAGTIAAYAGRAPPGFSVPA